MTNSNPKQSVAPRVSVVMGTYNRANTILRAAQSVLNQTFRDLELIIVDDASTDATLAQLKRIVDPRLRVITFKKNRGNSATLNEAIEQALGEWIAIQDSDDEWLPHKLERQMRELDRVSETSNGKPIAGIVARTEFVDRHRQAFPPWHIDLSEGIELKHLLEGNRVSHPTLVVKRSALLEIAGYDETLRKSKDREMLIRLLQQYRLLGLNDVLLKSYVVDINTTHSLAPDSLWRILDKHRQLFQDIDPQKLSDQYFLVASEFMRLGRKHDAHRTLAHCITIRPTCCNRAHLALSRVPGLDSRIAIFPYRLIRRTIAEYRYRKGRRHKG